MCIEVDWCLVLGCKNFSTCTMKGPNTRYCGCIPGYAPEIPERVENNTRWGKCQRELHSFLFG